jgi:hypothetical protein
MRSDWEYSADCIQALAQGGDEDKAWDGAVLVAEFMHHINAFFRGGRQ